MINRRFAAMSLFFLAGFSLLSAQLKGSNNQADYLIIIPSQFQATIQPFADWRQSKGLKVKVTALDQIYAEFGSSDSQHVVVRDFISYALQYWQKPSPRYVLLAGGTKYIRSLRVSSSLKWAGEDSVSIDEWYAINKYEADTKPDVALGRFPAENADELKSMIDKTTRFEDELKRQDYVYDFVVATDDDTISTEAFEAGVSSFISTVSPVNPRYARYDIRQSSVYHGQRKDIFGAVEKTTLFLSYFGHGNPKQWSRTGIVTLSDVDSLCRQDKPFVLFTVACNQNFDVVDGKSIPNRLLTHPTSGAVASFASSGLNFVDSQVQFQSKVFTTAHSNSGGKLGDYILQTKRMLITEQITLMDDPTRRMTILGDPALRWPLQTVTDIEPPNPTTPNTYALSQNYPNPFNPTTTIEFSVGTYGHTFLQVFDVLGRKVAVLVNEVRSPGTYKFTWDASNLPSGVYLYRMQAGNFVETRKMVLAR